MENEKKWVPSPEALELEFVRNTMGALRENMRDFAKANSIGYEVEEPSREGFLILPGGGDFKKLEGHIRQMAETINALFDEHKKNYSVEVEEYENGIQIQALKKKKK